MKQSKIEKDLNELSEIIKKNKKAFIDFTQN